MSILNVRKSHGAQRFKLKQKAIHSKKTNLIRKSANNVKVNMQESVKNQEIRNINLSTKTNVLKRKVKRRKSKLR